MLPRISGLASAAFEVTSDYVQNYVHGWRILIITRRWRIRPLPMATKNRALLRADESAARPVADTRVIRALCNMAKVFASEEILKSPRCIGLHGGNGHDARLRDRELFRTAAISSHRTAPLTCRNSRS